MGVVFGLNEDLIKSRLAASADAVDATVYHGDSVAVEALLSKSWTYMQRAHPRTGAFGCAVFWLWAGFRAPALDGTDAANQSPACLAIPLSGAVVTATLAAAVLVVLTLLRKRDTQRTGDRAWREEYPKLYTRGCR